MQPLFLLFLLLFVIFNTRVHFTFLRSPLPLDPVLLEIRLARLVSEQLNTFKNSVFDLDGSKGIRVRYADYGVVLAVDTNVIKDFYYTLRYGDE